MRKIFSQKCWNDYSLVRLVTSRYKIASLYTHHTQTVRQKHLPHRLALKVSQPVTPHISLYMRLIFPHFRPLMLVVLAPRRKSTLTHQYPKENEVVTTELMT